MWVFVVRSALLDTQGLPGGTVNTPFFGNIWVQGDCGLQAPFKSLLDKS